MKVRVRVKGYWGGAVADRRPKHSSNHLAFKGLWFVENESEFIREMRNDRS